MYDHTIQDAQDWVALRAEVIVDPMIYRAGEIFLAGGGQAGPGWDAVSGDIGALVSFFDLLLLHEQLPAFNYGDTFDAMACGLDTSMFDMVNSRAKVIHQVNVTYDAYWRAKNDALATLCGRVNGDDLLSPALQQDLADELSAAEYHWNPSLGSLEESFSGTARTTASFLLGSLVFSAYAQQTGAPHLMSAKRSRLFAASALTAPRAGADVEADLYRELDRRFRDEGDGWRDRHLPWTPSFVPFLLRDVDPYRFRPADLLDEVFALRERRSVREYRQTRALALAGDDDAYAELGDLADAMAQSMNRPQLGGTRTVLVELLPKAFSAAAGAALGVAVGPAGAATAAGVAVAAVAGEEIVRQVSGKLWGFVLPGLPLVSARKLLQQSVRAEQTTMARLDSDLRKIWQN